MLEELVRTDGPWVTILSPVGGGGPLTRKEDPVRYRNLVRQAAEQLQVRMGDGDGATADAIVERLRAVGNDHAVFASGAPGLVVFANRDGTRLWHLPEPVEEKAIVDERPHLEALLPLVSDAVRFYVLALSLHGARLWSCDRHEAHELSLPDGTPARLEDAAGWEIEEQHLQYHGFRGHAGHRPIYHAQGGGEDDRSVDVEKYLRAVARGVEDAVPEPEAPMVLACDPALEDTFRRITQLKSVLEPALHGNHQRTDGASLHAAAWPLVAPRFERPEEDARRRFLDLRGTGRTSDRIEDVVPAACEGRVDTLFVRKGSTLEGIFDPHGWRVHLEEGAVDRPTTDLVDRAATDTFMNRGRVFVVPSERMPTDDTAVAAILRY
jgi:hypothetical protein